MTSCPCLAPFVASGVYSQADADAAHRIADACDRLDAAFDTGVGEDEALEVYDAACEAWSVPVAFLFFTHNRQAVTV